MPKANNRPLGENSANLVTLMSFELTTDPIPRNATLCRVTRLGEFSPTYWLIVYSGLLFCKL
jgi:hypothetical protein